FEISEPFEYALINITNDDIKPTAIIKNTKSNKYNELFIKDATVPSYVHHVNYGDIAHFLMTNMFFIEGDSGAPVISYSPDLRTISLCGILDGGGDQGTVVTSIKGILEHSNLELITNIGN
ncbi:9130_t:CDS:2, partial [Racocetra fulgida]